MTPKALAAAMMLSLLATAAAAQVAEPEPQPEPAVAAESDEDVADPATDTRRKIRVLEHPYDISSFYRSGGSSSDSFLLGPDGSERYPIAGFYRQGGGRGYGYSQFWTTGYGDRGFGRGRGRVRARDHRLGLGFRRAIGENGDLFLFAPTFLAPIGPLTGVFFEGGR